MDWRITAVGDELHFDKRGEQPYFVDFLRSYLQNKLTPEFGNSELTKEPSNRHPVIQWYDRMHFYQIEYANLHGVANGIPAIGAMNAWYRLAYDLFLIKHNAQLQEFMLKRLRKREKFQGARFELVCIASMICAGYKIEFEDEDKPEQKHVEFIAVGADGLRIAVEAKSKHREGVLGYSRGGRYAGLPMATSLGVDTLIANALAKEPRLPYFVFIEINLPGVPAPQDGAALFEELQSVVDKAVASYPPNQCPANAFFFCNDLSHHTLSDKSAVGDTWCVVVPVDAPLVPLDKQLIQRALEGFLARLNIPTHFPPDR
jgi:hypothetical protein